MLRISYAANHKSVVVSGEMFISGQGLQNTNALIASRNSAKCLRVIAVRNREDSYFGRAA
jgi:hypothetical protein